MLKFDIIIIKFSIFSNKNFFPKLKNISNKNVVPKLKNTILSKFESVKIY